ncbi:uncharacterized protein SAPINGB_P005587 [Magnusiomyces paraingens]|uniref:DUF1640 domain-containing protein n=1 Tax=Magnusiomyces paraingens TaxID=2606893 RepID=A0A5E8C7L3_9ASCO|nr:uncharacterized protein SAPINGB_P005587 [Saprochaete ingens]VVT57206.1 unnamed protein product [Saprochaete ingens]
MTTLIRCIAPCGRRQLVRSPITSTLLNKRNFSSSLLCRDSHFDTRRFMIQLERQGFSATQAEAVLKAVASVIDDGIGNLQRNLVSKEEFSRQSYQQKVDFAKLRSELQTLDKTDATRIATENERLKTDIDKLRQKFKEEIAKQQASVRLDLNLEKGRVREESSKQELKIAETRSRIDQEMSNFKTQIEATKLQVVQWLIGVCTGAFALVLAYIRLLT